MPLFSDTPLTKRRHQFREAVIYNRSLYSQFQLLSAIPFVIDQWQGMPVCIRRLDHIKELNEYQVRQFLCGYEIPVVGDLNEMKGCLAVGMGVSEKDAEDTFGYVYEVTRKKKEKEQDEEGDKLEEEGYPENARSIHNFAHLKYSYINENVLFGEASFNSWQYLKSKTLNPIPLLIAQPEGMPYYIQTLDDIKRLTEDEVKVFLRGYNQPIKGTLNEMKRWLALMLGVSYEDAVGTFGDVHYVKQYTENDNDGETSLLYEVSLDYRKEIFWKETTAHYLGYEKERVLEPVRFVLNQSEIMPFHIRRLDDIKKLTEDQVELYLRGYCQPIKETPKENKRWLAMILGVSREDADTAFACES